MIHGPSVAGQAGETKHYTTHVQKYELSTTGQFSNDGIPKSATY